VTFDWVHDLLGAATDWAIGSFGKREDNIISFHPQFFDPRRMWNVLESVQDPEFRNRIWSPLRHIAVRCRSLAEKDWDQLLVQIPCSVPSVLMIDGNTYKAAGKHVADKVIASWDTPQVGCACIPNFLSPEMLSEFPESITDETICEMMNTRASSQAVSVTVYLYDLLTVFGGFSRTRPMKVIQRLKGHCRFQFPLSIEEMSQAMEMNHEIRDFLERTKRSV
jgi:hypothetical protein